MLSSADASDPGHLDRLLSIISSVFDAYSAVLFLLNRKTGEYRMAAKFSLGERIREDVRVSPGRGLAGWVLRHNQPLLVNDLVKKKAKIEYYDEEERQVIRAFMGCPLKRVDGVLCVDSKRSHSFAEKDQKILHLFGDYVQEMLEATQRLAVDAREMRYYHATQRIQELRRRHSKWNEFLAATLDELAEATGFDRVFLATRDETGQRYALEGSNAPILPPGKERECFDFGAGLVGWVFKNNQCFFTGEDETSGQLSPLFGKQIKTPPIKSAVCLPLVVRRIPRGVLGLSHGEPLVIDEAMKSFLLFVADQLALFLENLYCKHRLRQHHEGDPAYSCNA